MKDTEVDQCKHTLMGIGIPITNLREPGLRFMMGIPIQIKQVSSQWIEAKKKYYENKVKGH